MSAVKSWYLDLELGIEEGGSKGMRSAQCAANQEFGFARNVMRDDDGGAMGLTAWIDDRHIEAALLYFQEDALLHMFRTWVRCTIKRGQLQKVTKIWNWIDGGDHDLAPERWWDVLRTECPWAFDDPGDTNSCKFTYGRSQTPNFLRLKIDRFRRQPATA
jgi:hypothetical protein